MVIHKDISASEAASRLNLHIKTAQDYLDELSNLSITDKREVIEGKRPYFRYTLIKKRIKLDFDLNSLYDNSKEQKHLNK